VRFVALIILLAVMTGIRLFKLGGAYDDPLARTMISFGFLIFTGMVAGQLASRLTLPRITGYLFAGMLCGPYVLGLIDLDVVERLRTVDELALALIAFTAGGELRIDRLKRASKAIASITLLQTVFALTLGATAAFIAALVYGAFAGLPLLAIAGVALFFGLVSAANSPSTAVAVIVETKASGPMTEQVLGVTVLKDILIILLVAIVLTVGGWMLKPSGPLQMALVGRVLFETAISIVAGGVAAGLIILYLRYVRRQMVLFVVAVSLLIVYQSELLHLHFLLVCITAGFIVENFSSYGERLIHAIERTSMTVFVIFFAMAGAMIDFSAAGSTWIIALAFVLVRAGAFAASAALSGKITGGDRMATRYSWMGYLGQAGVSLGIASLVLKTYPHVGSAFYTIVVATIAINQVIGPIALKLLLVKAGETEKQVQPGTAEEALL
jgi:Kef-type K+ transport system membrane component KefB